MSKIKKFIGFGTLFIITILFVVWLYSAWYESNKEFVLHLKGVKRGKSIDSCGENFNYQLAKEEKFLEQFLRGYFKSLSLKGDSKIAKQFFINGYSNFNVYIILSSESEAYMEMNHGEGNLLYDCVKYPVQMSAFSGLGIDPRVTFDFKSHPNFLAEYKSAPFAISTERNSMMIIQQIEAIQRQPHFFRMGPNSLILLQSSKIIFETQKFKNRKSSDGLIFLSSEKSFEPFIDKAYNFGRQFASGDITNYILFSNEFRRYQAETRLRPLVESIELKKSENDKGVRIYQIWESRNDLMKLQKEAEALNMDASDLKHLMEDPSLKPKDGIFLWYYRNHLEFVIQWALLNLAICFAYFFAYINFDKLYNYNPLVSVIPITVLNKYVLGIKPPDLSLLFCFIPISIWILCLYICHLLKKYEIPGNKFRNFVGTRRNPK